MGSPFSWIAYSKRRLRVARLALVVGLFPVAVTLVDAALRRLGAAPRNTSALAILSGTLVMALTMGLVNRRVERDLQARLELAREAAEAQHRYRMLVENSADVVASATADGTVDWISESVQRLVGRAPVDFVGHRFVEFLHPDDVSRAIAAQPALMRGDTVEIETRIRTGDGQWRWISSRIRPLCDDDGRVVGRVANWRDVEAEHEVREQLERSEAHYRLLADNAVDVIVRFGADFDTEWVSPSVEPVLGWTPEQLYAVSLLELVPEEDRAIVRRGHAELQALGQTAYRTRFRHGNGEYHWIGVRAAAVYDSDGTLSGVTAAWRDIDSEVASERQLQELATRDPLTGILNRSAAYARLDEHLQDPRRPSHGVGLLFCDLDNLKHLNDLHGHAVGDDVLRTLAVRIGSMVRGDDFVARVGGDEFLVVLAGADDLQDVAGLGERLRASVAEPIAIGGRILSTTVSIGGVVARRDEHAETAIARADRAMYLAKTSGRDRVVLSDD